MPIKNAASVSPPGEMLQMRCLDAQNRKNISRMTELMGSKWEDQPLFKEQKAHTIIGYIDR